MKIFQKILLTTAICFILLYGVFITMHHIFDSTPVLLAIAVGISFAATILMGFTYAIIEVWRW